MGEVILAGGATRSGNVWILYPSEDISSLERIMVTVIKELCGEKDTSSKLTAGGKLFVIICYGGWWLFSRS